MELDEQELIATRKLNGATNKIEIGEYVRTKNGKIRIVKNTVAQYYITNRLNISDNNKFTKEDIVKHSKNIIDLIKVGDIVKVKDNDWIRILYANDEEMLNVIIEDILEENYELLSILTKEQFEQIEYRLEE